MWQCRNRGVGSDLSASRVPGGALSKVHLPWAPLAMPVPSPAQLRPTSRLLGDNSEGQERENSTTTSVCFAPALPVTTQPSLHGGIEAAMSPRSSVSIVLGAEPFLLARGMKTTCRETPDLPAAHWADRGRGGDGILDRSRGSGRAPCPNPAGAENAQPQLHHPNSACSGLVASKIPLPRGVPQAVQH